MPREGAVVTVYYHDEAYGDKTDVDEYALAAAQYAEEPEVVALGDKNDELTDSADAPGSLDLGEGEHASLTYGNEVFHVANVITDAEETIGAPSLPGGDGNKPSQPAPTTNNTTSSSATAPGAGGSGTPAAPTSGAHTTTRSTTTTPATDDRLFGLNGLLSAAAAAGVALTAYSARCIANEHREASNKD